ncbi:MAG TPA: glycosyltransferase, partial [Thermoanaerobaculia bacterium]
MAAGPMIREITAIFVSWKDGSDVLGAVAALAEARARVPPSGVDVALVVVDNAGGDLSEALLRRIWPGATLVVNTENRGFGPAANQAAARASGQIVFFLNPDTRAEGEPFTAIARAFADDPRVVAVAPRLVEMDGASAPEGRLVLGPPSDEDQATFQLRRL